MLTECLVILALTLANGFFAGAEIAVVSLRKSRLQQLAEEGHRSALAVFALRQHPERFLATVQIGITVVTATAAAFGGASISVRLEPALQRLGVPEAYAGDLALGIVVISVSYLSIVVGELVPKSLALRSAERYAMLVGRLLLGLSWVARPLVWFLTASSNVLLKPFGDRTNFTEARLSADELRQIVQEAASTGSVDSRSGEIASRALDFGDLLVSDVMVPRNRMRALPASASIGEMTRLLIESGHARMPVHEGSRDNVIGYVTMRDVLAAQLRGTEDSHAILRTPHFIPEAAKALAAFQEMQRKHSRLAIVVDEHGGVAGLVTLEDLLEELVGELFSEDDPPEETIRWEQDGTAIVRGDTAIRDINRALGLTLDEEQSTSIAGLCIALAGRIPAKGAVLESPDGTVLEVLEATPRLARIIRLVPPAGKRKAAPTA